MTLLRTTVETLRDKRQRGEVITALGAYDSLMARLLDEAGIDLIFVGDSLGPLVLGIADVTEVSLYQMIHHAAAVVRGAPHAFVVCDLPFVSCQGTISHTAKEAATAIRETGAGAVKIDGGREIARRLAGVVRSGIEVMGYIAFPVGDTSLEAADSFAADARALEDAGCFAILMSNAPAYLAAMITESSEAITISLNSGVRCHGQMAITFDMLGLCPVQRWFAPPYANLYPQMRQAVRQFCEDSRRRSVLRCPPAWGEAAIKLTSAAPHG